MIKVIKITSPEDSSNSRKIRMKVFVEEQHVPEDEEMDEFESSSKHYLAFMDGKPAGTARWRYTEKGVKLERFAVYIDYRNKGVGSALMQFILDEIKNLNPPVKGDIYLHSQLDAMPLYSKFGFKKTGNMFEEAGIKHFKMIKEEN